MSTPSPGSSIPYAGRGGRGRGRSRFYHRGKPKQKTATAEFKEKEFKFKINGGSKNVASYDEVVDAILLKIKTDVKEYPLDILEEVRTSKTFDIESLKPVFSISEPKNVTTGYTAIEKANIDMEMKLHADEVAEWRLRKSKLEMNRVLVYGFIWKEFCDDKIKNRIEARDDFDAEGCKIIVQNGTKPSAKPIEDNPVLLLKAAKTASSQTKQNQYDQVQLVDTAVKMLNMRQHDEETISEYYKRFKQVKEEYKILVGDDFLKSFTEQQSEYILLSDEDSKKKLISKSYEKYAAYVFVRGVCDIRYKQYKNNLPVKFAEKDDKYPRSVKNARDILSQIDSGVKQKHKGTVPDIVQVHAQPGNQKQFVCYACGEIGHKSTECTKNVPKDQWWIKKKYMQLYVHTRTSDSSTVTSGLSSTTGWAEQGNHFMVCRPCREPVLLSKNKNKDRSIILDSGSSISIFSNGSMLEDIHTVKKGIIMATNAGDMVVDKQGILPGFGPVWYEPRGIANIFGLKDLAKKHRIRYDSSKEDAFLVSFKNGTVIRFSGIGNDLYKYVPKHYKVHTNVSTVQEHESYFPARQVESAQKALAFVEDLGVTMMEAKAMIRGNMIRNCPFTHEDITRAELIYGGSVANLKGKTTRKTPVSVNTEDGFVNVDDQLYEDNDL